MRTCIYNVFMRTPLDNAFYAAGGQATVARALGISRQRITNWKGRGFPVGQCKPLEDATGGLVHRKLTRPLDWRKHWPELVKPRKAKAA